MAKRKQNNKRNGKKVQRKNQSNTQIIRQPKTHVLGHSLANKICSVYDPFCPHAHGAKLPGRGSLRSIAATIKFSWNIVQSATEFGTVVICPDKHHLATLLQASATSTASTMAASYTAALSSVTSFYSNVSQVRIVSAGVEYTPIVAATAAKPLLFIQTANDSQGLTSDVIYAGEYFKDPDAKILPNSPFTWVRQAMDARSDDFQDYDPTTGIADEWGTALVISVYPGTSQTIGVAQVTINIEYIPPSTSTMQMVTPRSNVPKEVLSLRDTVADNVGAITPGNTSVFTNMAKKAATKVASVLMQAGVTYATKSLSAGRGAALLMDTAMEVD